MNWRRRRKRSRSNSAPGTGGVARRAGVVVRSKWLSLNLPPVASTSTSHPSIHSQLSFTTSVTAQLCRTEEFLQWGMTSPQRLRWLFTENPIYFITTCTYRRRPILDRPDVHETFIQFGLHAIEQGVRVGRYVLMPDHIHLFAGFGPESKSLSAWSRACHTRMRNAILRLPDSSSKISS